MTAVTVLSGLPPVVVAVEPVPGGVPDPVAMVTPAPSSRAGEHERGRRLVRRLAREVLGAHDVVIAVTDRGAPYLVDHRAGVSISHTASHTAAAIWPYGPVGVDVELPPAVLDERLVRRCCGRWSGYVNGLPDPARSATFARVWTAQEACVKAMGLGLAGAPWRIPIDPRSGQGWWRRVFWVAQQCAVPAALAVAVDMSKSFVED
ncbi:MAG TPA: 4'-phosphopantetheinyl transferase superfamily protein [Candidatus Limnocylindrales bacterium]|nr:4'-phosphopantetheinyl transferase superfamily protein [Candidatus Limnocylindrales bacterium]